MPHSDGSVLDIAQLSSNDAYTYWHKRDANEGAVMGLLILMDNVEQWVIEKTPSISESERQARLNQLADIAREKLATMPAGSLRPSIYMIKVLASINSSKALATIDYLNQFHPDFFEELTLFAAKKASEGEESARVLVRRIRALFRTILINQIFTPKNIGQVIQAMMQPI
jgi:hypothetical protein